VVTTQAHVSGKDVDLTVHARRTNGSFQHVEPLEQTFVFPRQGTVRLRLRSPLCKCLMLTDFQDSLQFNLAANRKNK